MSIRALKSCIVPSTRNNLVIHSSEYCCSCYSSAGDIISTDCLKLTNLSLLHNISNHNNNWWKVQPLHHIDEREINSFFIWNHLISLSSTLCIDKRRDIQLYNYGESIAVYSVILIWFAA